MSVLYPFEKAFVVESLKPLLLKKQYAVTSLGRVISFEENMNEGTVVGAKHEGYLALKLKPKNGKPTLTVLIHKLVAEYFLDPPTPEQLYVIHKDHNKQNNHPDNLKWVTKKEWWDHWKTSDAVKESLKKLTAPRQQGHKLSSTDVLRIKKMLNDPHRKNTVKRIAKMFGVSDMQIHRIKSGENWSHVKL